MLKIFCDKCEQPSSTVGHRRYENVSGLPAGGALGLEMVPLYNGQAGTGHLCDGCLQAMLAQVAGLPARETAVQQPDPRLGQLSAETQAQRQEIEALHKWVVNLQSEADQSADELRTTLKLVENERTRAERWKKRSEDLLGDLRKRDEEVISARSNLADRERSSMLAEAETKLRRELSTQESRLAREWGTRLRALQDDLATLRQVQAS